MDQRQIAEAFSGHRFADVYPHLGPDVRWRLPGDVPLVGRDTVIAACESSQEELSQVAAEFMRFVSVADTSVAAVDVVARYTAPDGSVSVVSSADIYEFDDAGMVTTITSYAVELEVDEGDPPVTSRVCSS